MSKTTKPTPRWRDRRSWALVIAAAACCAAAGTAAAAQPSSTAHFTRSAPLFASNLIGAGGSVTGTIDLPASGVAGLTPYLQFRNVHDGCSTGTSCLGSPGELSKAMTFTVVGADRRAWSGTIRDLRHGITLPGDAPSATAALSYDVTASLPATATNASSLRTLSFDLEYGSNDRSGHAVTKVLGEGFGRPGISGTTGAVAASNNSGSSLPFTGADLAIDLAAAAAAIALGASALIVGRRKHRTHAA